MKRAESEPESEAEIEARKERTKLLRVARMEANRARKENRIVAQSIHGYNSQDLHGFTLMTTASRGNYFLMQDGECANIAIENGTLHISSLNKCGHSGSYTLQQLIAFAARNGLRMSLVDKSTLPQYGIDLPLFNILQTGQTWYGRHGFRNGLTDHQAGIQAYIQSEYDEGVTIQERAIELARLLKSGDTRVIPAIKAMCKDLTVYINAEGLQYTDNTLGGKRTRMKRKRRITHRKKY